MAETKYGKYIITDYSGRPESDCRDEDEFLKILPEISVPIAYLDNNMINGSFYAECMWYHTATDIQVEPHTHNFDEILGFFGSDPKDLRDLSGEIELWLGDEKHILTKSCMVFIPKGLVHSPLILRRIDKPVFHFSIGPSGIYDKKEN
jgi:hypothetical protein